MWFKNFLLYSKNEKLASVVWNMAGSIVSAFQSVVFLMILTRTVGLVQAGIFTIAYANANLFLNIGKYGMRCYQVSDVQEQYSFKEYAYSRGITVVAMLAVSFVYTGYAAVTNGYSSEKFWIIIWMCFYKAADAVEDVFCGNYQQKGRLDVASKVLVIRTGITVLVYAIGIVLLHNQLYALVIATIISYVLMIWLLHDIAFFFRGNKETMQIGQVIQLLKSCFPLFIGCFLSFYIGNAPKYAIDAQLSDEVQACYGFIAMPVFVIGMLNNFIFNPLLHKMAILWGKRNISEFMRKILLQVGIIVIITIVCIIGAWLIGIPVLSWLYHTNLAPYKTEMLIILAGGGFLGLSGMLNAMITVIRFQKSVAWGYSVVAVLAFLLSDSIVRMYGIMGAALMYTILMGGLSMCFGGMLIVGMYVKKYR